MSLEERRARFEAGARQRGLMLERASQAMMFSNGRRVRVGDYIVAESARAWEAFCDALDGAVVEMPPTITVEDVASELDIDDDLAVRVTHMVNGAILSCGAMVKAAGLKVAV